MTGIILSFREKVEKIVLRCWYFKNAFHFALMKLLHYSFMSPFSTAFRIIWNCFMYFVCVEESKSMNEKNLQKSIFRILFKHHIEINVIYNPRVCSISKLKWTQKFVTELGKVCLLQWYLLYTVNTTINHKQRIFLTNWPENNKLTSFKGYIDDK